MAQPQKEFDFSGLFELLTQMKRKFWNYDRSQDRHKRQRARLHNQYFAKLNPRGEQSAISKKIQKALRDSVKKNLGEGVIAKYGYDQPDTYNDEPKGLPNDQELNELLGLNL